MSEPSAVAQDGLPGQEPPSPSSTIATTPSVTADPATTRTTSKVDEEKPNEIFKRMVVKNGNQDANISKRIASNGPSKGRGSSQQRDAPKKFASVRFIVCTLGVLSLAMSQMNRMVINICITSMVDPSMMKPKAGASSDGSCLGRLANVTNELATTTPKQLEFTTTLPSTSLYETTNAFGIYDEPGTSRKHERSAEDTTQWNEYQTTYRPETTTHHSFNYQGDEGTTELETTTTTTTTPTTSNDSPTTTLANALQVFPITEADSSQPTKFKWTIQQQSFLLGGFFWSYFVFMILGGWIAEMYGAKYVLLLGVAGSSAISLATPWIAHTSLTLLVFSRIVMGTLQSGVFPAMYAVIARWLTMSEASIYAPMIKMNLRLGMLFASLLPGLVPSWQNVFYLTGTIGAVWSMLWLFLATSDPADNKLVSREELAHIMKKKRKKPDAQTDSNNNNKDMELADMRGGAEEKVPAKKVVKTPWLKIITHPSVIGLIIVKFTANTGLDFLSIELPSYLKYVHHTPTEQISFITTFMFSLQVGLIVFVGWIAKTVVKQSPFGMSKTTVRKLFQGTASFGVGSCLFLITFNNCSLVYVIVLLQFTSILSMFAAGGETMLPYDISDQFPATIMAIANSIANLSGLTVTTLTGKILGDQGGSYDRWNLLLYLIAGANIVGGLVFIILVKAEMIDFSDDNSSTKQVSIKESPAKPEEAPAVVAQKVTQVDGAAEPIQCRAAQ